MKDVRVSLGATCVWARQGITCLKPKAVFLVGLLRCCFGMEGMNGVTENTTRKDFKAVKMAPCKSLNNRRKLIILRSLPRMTKTSELHKIAAEGRV